MRRPNGFAMGSSALRYVTSTPVGYAVRFPGLAKSEARFLAAQQMWMINPDREVDDLKTCWWEG
jgi:hypothetical protein